MYKNINKIILFIVLEFILMCACIIIANNTSFAKGEKEAKEISLNTEVRMLSSLIEGGGMPCNNIKIKNLNTNNKNIYEDIEYKSFEEKKTLNSSIEEKIIEVNETAEQEDSKVNNEETFNYPIYSINGDALSKNLQIYLYCELSNRGIEWFYEYALCQIYQESRFNHNVINSNGLDMGLCQFRITYFPKFAKEAGLYQADIMNPIDSIYVYAYLMSKYIKSTGNVNEALSKYYTGGEYYCQTYVDDVTQWLNYLK